MNAQMRLENLNDDEIVLEDVRTRPGIGEIRKLIEGKLPMKTNVKSLAFACGLAIMVFSWGRVGPRQGFTTFSSSGVPAGMNTGGFAGLAGFYQGYGYPAPAAPVAFFNPPPVARAEGPDQLRAVL